MKRIVYTCDKCGKEISHVAYSLVCYAEDVSAQSGGGISEEAAAQNIKQNMELGTFEKSARTKSPTGFSLCEAEDITKGRPSRSPFFYVVIHYPVRFLLWRTT